MGDYRWSFAKIKNWYTTTHVVLELSHLRDPEQIKGSEWKIFREGDKDFRPELFEGRPYMSKPNVVTDVILRRAFFIQMRSITKNNYVEFYNRSRVVSMLYGSDFSNGNNLTLEDIKMHIGLEVNGSRCGWKKFIEWTFNKRFKEYTEDNEYSMTDINTMQCIDYFRDKEWDYDYDVDEGRTPRDNKG